MCFLIKRMTLLILFVFYPSVSFAYIDPGILSIVTQSLFAIVSGGIAAWVLTPWKLLKSFICQIFSKKESLKITEKTAKNTSNSTDNHDTEKSE